MNIARFAIFATSTGVGGMERLIASLTRQSAQAGIVVETRFAPAPGIETTLDWLRGFGVHARVETAAMSSHQAQSWRSLLAFRGLLRRMPAQLVNLHYGVSHISLKETLAVRLAGRACVATVHAATPWSECGEGARESTRRAAGLCQAVIVHSQATWAHLREAGVAARKIHLVPCGIPAPAQTICQEQARTRLNLPPKAFVIASVARLVREKGIDDLIAAAAAMPDSSMPTHLVIAGDGPERNALEAQAASHLGKRALSGAAAGCK